MSSKNNRGALSPNRVKLLKDAMKYKYAYSEEKASTTWKLISPNLNGKGRNIKYKLKSIANELKLRLRITALEKAEQEDGE